MENKGSGGKTHTSHINPRKANEIYRELDISKVVNACFLSTILGGSSLPNEVLKTAVQANEEFALIWEMQERAGKRIAELTGAEAAHVTTGTYGGMVLSAAACMAGTDRNKKAKLPSETDGLADEFIIQKCVRYPKYNRAIQTAGGSYVPVGDSTGCTISEIEAEIDEHTAGIVYVAPGPGPWPGPDYVKGEKEGYEGATNAVELEHVIEIAHCYDVPVIVDAAGQTYPTEGLSRYTDMGADLVCYSGKYIMGPNATGFIIGKENLVEAAFHNSFIGDESYALTEPKEVEYIPDDEHTKQNDPREPTEGNRTYGIGRGYKLDRFDIIATVKALEYWLEIDHETERLEPARQRGEYIMNQLDSCPQIDAELKEYYYHNLPLEVTFKTKTGSYLGELKSQLLENDPMVYPRSIETTGASEPKVCLNMLWLQPEEEEIIAERLKEIVHNR